MQSISDHDGARQQQGNERQFPTGIAPCLLHVLHCSLRLAGFAAPDEIDGHDQESTDNSEQQRQLHGRKSPRMLKNRANIPPTVGTPRHCFDATRRAYRNIGQEKPAGANVPRNPIVLARVTGPFERGFRCRRRPSAPRNRHRPPLFPHEFSDLHTLLQMSR